MAICGYLVIPAEGETATLAQRLARLPGCDVVAARNRDVLVLVTETSGPAAEAALRERLRSMPGIRSLALTFGDLSMDASGPGSHDE